METEFKQKAATPGAAAASPESVSSTISSLLTSFGKTMYHAQFSDLEPSEFDVLRDIESDLTEGLKSAQQDLAKDKFSEAAQRGFATKVRSAFASARERLDDLSQPGHTRPAQHMAVGLEKDIVAAQKDLQTSIPAMNPEYQPS